MPRHLWFFALIGLLLFVGLSAPCQAEDYTVNDIVIEGNHRVDPTAIRAAAGIKPDTKVSLEEIDRGISAIFRLARFSDVRARLETRGGKQSLIYTVVERPLVRSVKFSGNDEITEEKLKVLVTIKPPDIYDPLLLDKNIETMLKLYEEEGFYTARIEPQIKINDLNEAHITLKVTEGEEIRIDAIRFSGNKVFSDKVLKQDMETRERWWLSWMTGRGAYQEELLKNDLSLITDMYFDNGYIQNKIHQPQVTLIDDNQYLDILIEIEEGGQYRIGELDVKGDLLRNKDELLDKIKLKPGDIFSRKLLREGMMTVNDLYADEGYAYVNVAPLSQIDPKSHLVSLMIEIEQGPLVTTRKIDITGNEKTIDKVVRREMKLIEGERFSGSKIKESRRRLQNLGYFEEVKISSQKAAVNEEMDVKVEVKEKPTGTFSLGFGYSSIDGLIGQTSVTQDNLFGRGLKANLSASFGSKSTTYQFGLLDPHFLDSKFSLGFDLYNSDREWSDFSKKATGGDIKLGFPVTESTRAFFIYRYEEKEIYDIDASATSLISDQEGRSTLSSIFGSLSRDTTDYRLDPTTGTLSSASIEFAGLGGTEKFAKYELDHRYFYPLFWKFVFSAHGRIGFIQEVQGEPIPIDERYYLGGLNSLRGFSPREVGPRVRTYNTSVDPVTGTITTIPSGYEYTGGNKDAYGNLEITFPLIPDSGFKGVIFYDAGNAWGEEEDYFSDIRYSAGGGLRWLSPLGPLRLEWGYNFKPRDEEPRSDLQFSIGTMF